MPSIQIEYFKINGSRFCIIDYSTFNYPVFFMPLPLSYSRKIFKAALLSLK